MKPLLALVALTAVLSGPANAQDAAPVVEAPAPDAAAPEPAAAPASSGEGFQVARAGDTRMTCEALLNEINALNNEITDSQSAMSARAMDIGRDRMRGAAGASVASTAMNMGVGVAAALIPGAGLALGAVQGITSMAGQAAAAAQQANQERQMSAMMTDMTAAADAMMPKMNRIDRLTDISIQKGC